MKIKDYFFALFASTVTMLSISQEADPLNVISAAQLSSPEALNSAGGMAAFAASGSWTNYVTNPNITTAGAWVYGPLINAPSGTPSGSKVQSISWQWNVFNYDSRLITLLCESTLTYCFDISGNFGSGGSVSSYNIPASRSWRYAFKYSGSGAISPPLLGQHGSLAVLYQ
ncbi:MAG: hypothetical protein RL217_1927 [Pseudomonadota bacterium]|jgi:hypothetical protein